MKRRLPALAGILLLAAFTANAASEQIIKQRAKDLRDQNNTKQGISTIGNRAPTPVPAQRTVTFVTNAPPMGFTPEQQRLLRVQNSITDIRSGAPLDPVKKSQLEKDLTDLASGPKKPSYAVLSKFSGSLCGALTQRMLSRPTQARLVKNLNTAFNPGNYTAAQVDKAIADVQALFESNMIPKTEAGTIAADLRALSTNIGPPRS